MASIKGSEPFPREWDDGIPHDERSHLENIRRASNAVRVLRRRGKPHSAAQFRLEEALKDYRALLDHKQLVHDNPGLF